MKSTSPSRSTLVISVYKDDIALSLILDSLLHQTVDNFDVIVSEDCVSDNIKNCIHEYSVSKLHIQHLYQEDDGFRKNIALNRAIRKASTDHIIFIDGDCVLHPSFIEAHQQHAEPGIACTGRRLELGENISRKLRDGDISLSRLTNRFFYLLSLYSLIRDKAKNIESGFYSKFLNRLTLDRQIRLLGCNFSCSKQDLVKINGFNENYRAPGIGEDSDIDWRLTRSGVRIKNVKFSAIQYHLYHPRMYSPSEENIKLFEKTQSSDDYICHQGLNHHNS